MGKQRFEAELGLNTKEFDAKLQGAQSGFSGLAKHIGAITAAIGIASSAFAVLNSWFKKTEQGADFMNSTLRVSRQILTDLISGQKTQLGETIKLAQKENEVRFGNYKDAVKIAELERDIRKYRLESVDPALSLQQRYDAITKALEKQRDLEKYKKADIKEELDIVRQLLNKDLTNADLWKRYTDLKVQFLNADESESLRIIQFRNSLLNEMKGRADALVEAFTPLEPTIEGAAEAVDKLKDSIEKVYIGIPSFTDLASTQNMTAVSGISQILGEKSVYNAKLAPAPKLGTEQINQVTKALYQQEEAVGILSGAFDTLFNSTEKGFENMVNYFIGQIKKLMAELIARKIVMALFSKSNALGAVASAFNVTGIGGMASGGIAYGPTLTMVGEYSGASTNPEVVAPLNKLMQIMGGSQNVNVTVKGRIRGRDLDLVQRRY